MTKSCRTHDHVMNFQMTFWAGRNPGPSLQTAEEMCIRDSSSIGLILCRFPRPWAAAAPQYGQLRSYSRSSFPHFGQNMIPPPVRRFCFTSVSYTHRTEKQQLAAQLQTLSKDMLRASAAQLDALTGTAWENAAKRSTCLLYT